MCPTQTFTPGKLILSGEHAVVYGAPAISMAIDLYTIVKTTENPHNHITFDIINYNKKYQFTWPELQENVRQLEKRYQQFLDGLLQIADVCKKATDLLNFTVGNLFKSRQIQFKKGLHIQIQSKIPPGSGLGSSASVVIGLLKNLSEYFKVVLSTVELSRLVAASESLQHGKVSGLDAQTILSKNCIYFKNNNYQTRQILDFPIYLVNTGVPQCTTGQCVAEAASYFRNRSLVSNFERITDALDSALKRKDKLTINQLIRKNHRLLTDIGVVPKKVQQFISDLESTGAAAKISGAGAVQGDSAGCVWVLSDQDISGLTQHYNYSLNVTRGLS